MNESERKEQFLTAFKILEKELLTIASLKDDYVSFSRALNHIYYNRLNSVISLRDNYEFLKTASDVRNLLSHEVSTVIPTEDFLNRFISIESSIVDPITCYEASTKNVSFCSLKDSVYQAMALMDNFSLSHLPILDENHIVKGVFSRNVFFDYVILNKSVSISDDLKVSDFSEVCLLDGHLNERFVFVSRNLSVRKAFEQLVKNKAHEKNVALLLVTEHGLANEKLLGVISLTDLTKLSTEL
ncbi:MAG: CBS domain-containing protein [Bacilli bacterium]